MNDKPFKSINDQIKLLNKRGLITDGSTARILLQEGYYNIINGYKDPFIDKSKSAANGDDRYLSGTTFNDFYTLFCFDRELRQLTFNYLIKIEAIARTVITYTFADCHRSNDSYIDENNFCTHKSRLTTMSEKQHKSDLAKLINTFSSLAKSNTVSYIQHYCNCHSCVPIWVLANSLTFGNISHFFGAMLPDDRDLCCKNLRTATNRSHRTPSVYGSKHLSITSKTVFNALDTLVKYRNICAHDERLYCATVGGQKAMSYKQMLWQTELFLEPVVFDTFIQDILNLYNLWQTKMTVQSRSAIDNALFRQLMLEINQRKLSAQGTKKEVGGI